VSSRVVFAVFRGAGLEDKGMFSLSHRGGGCVFGSREEIVLQGLVSAVLRGAVFEWKGTPRFEIIFQWGFMWFHIRRVGRFCREYINGLSLSMDSTPLHHGLLGGNYSDHRTHSLLPHSFQVQKEDRATLEWHFGIPPLKRVAASPPVAGGLGSRVGRKQLPGQRRHEAGGAAAQRTASRGTAGENGEVPGGGS
jgi:hypothetical protein